MPLTKLGDALLILSGSNSYGGGTVVEAGTLEVLNSSALPDGGSLTVAAGGTFIFTSGLAPSATTQAAQAVPEPGTLVLLAGLAAAGFLSASLAGGLFGEQIAIRFRRNDFRSNRLFADRSQVPEKIKQ